MEFKDSSILIPWHGTYGSVEAVYMYILTLWHGTYEAVIYILIHGMEFGGIRFCMVWELSHPLPPPQCFQLSPTCLCQTLQQFHFNNINSTTNLLVLLKTFYNYFNPQKTENTSKYFAVDKTIRQTSVTPARATPQPVYYSIVTLLCSYIKLHMNWSSTSNLNPYESKASNHGQSDKEFLQSVAQQG